MYRTAFVACLMMVVLGGCKKTPENETLMAARRGGSVTEIYCRIIRQDSLDLEQFTLAQFKEVRRLLASAPAADPPSCSQRPGRIELFWAFALADLRRGRWEDRLKELCARSDPSQLWKAWFWLSAVGRPTGRFCWHLMRNVQDRSCLRDIWSCFVDILVKENARRPPPPGTPAPIPLAPEGGRPERIRYVVPDWGYLDYEETSRIVKREADFFESKWRFTCLLMRHGKEWVPGARRLRSWVEEKADLAARPLLEEVEAGKLGMEEFRRKTSRYCDALEYALVARYMARGPEIESSKAVAKWIEARLQAGQTDPSFSREAMTVDHILKMLPKWSTRFPWLKEVEARLREERGKVGVDPPHAGHF